jgi:hypothetical protein
MIAVQAPPSIASPLAVPSNAPEHCPVRIHPYQFPKTITHSLHRALTLTEQANRMPVTVVPIKPYVPLEQQNYQILLSHSSKHVWKTLNARFLSYQAKAVSENRLSQLN